MKLKKLLLSVLVAGAVSATGASASVLLTLNPSAPNTGCVDLAAGACGAIDPAHAAFTTNNATTGYTGILDIAAAAGATTFVEAGNLRILQFTGSASAATSGVNRLDPGGSYDIYAGFSASGTGTWGGNAFVTTSISTLNVTLYASPTSGTAASLGAPSSGSALTAAGQGITFGSEDFILGTASLLPSVGNNGISLLAPNNQANTSLQALLSFTPAAGTTGASGFFQAPVPFVITIASQQGGNTLNTTWVPFGAGFRISTLDNRGGGSLSFDSTPQQVPEPGSLALLGVGLAAMGFVGYRRRARS